MTGELDPDARKWARFYEILESVPRGGPGDPASTRRTLARMANLAVIAAFDTEIAMFECWWHPYSFEFFVGRRAPR